MEFRQRHPATRLSGIFYHINKLLATLRNLRYKYTKKEKLEKKIFVVLYYMCSLFWLKATPLPASFGVVFLMSGLFVKLKYNGCFLSWCIYYNTAISTYNEQVAKYCAQIPSLPRDARHLSLTGRAYLTYLRDACSANKSPLFIASDVSTTNSFYCASL